MSAHRTLHDHRSAGLQLCHLSSITLTMLARRPLLMAGLNSRHRLLQEALEAHRGLQTGPGEQAGQLSEKKKKIPTVLRLGSSAGTDAILI